MHKIILAALMLVLLGTNGLATRFTVWPSLVGRRKDSGRGGRREEKIIAPTLNMAGDWWESPFA